MELARTPQFGVWLSIGRLALRADCPKEPAARLPYLALARDDMR
jgi:hypothetical protein